MVRCDISQAVEWGDQDQPLHRAHACHANRDAASQAAPHDHDVPMFGMHLVEERQGSGKYGLLGWAAGTSAIARVVKQIDRMVGKGTGEVRHALRNILGITSKVDKRVAAGVGRVDTRIAPPLVCRVISVIPDWFDLGWGK
jgi:hypothetical protein